MRLGIGATDSMWPKKRRIRLRVLKAVAILRPRLGSRAANYPLLSRNSRPAKAARPIHCRGPLVEADREVRLEKRPGRADPGGSARPVTAYLSSTLAPSASSFALSFSASAFGTPSLTALGAAS